MKWFWIVWLILVTPLMALAADEMTPSGSAGVWAALGAFLGQVVSSRYVKRSVSEGIMMHETRCHLKGRNE